MFLLAFASQQDFAKKILDQFSQKLVEINMALHGPRKKSLDFVRWRTSN